MGGDVQSLCLILCDPMDCRAPGYSVLHYFPRLLKFMFIESVIPSSHFIFCHPLLLLPSIFPSVMVFSKESALHIRWPKYWSFSISPSNEYSGLISFRIEWFDILANQKEDIKSPLQLTVRKHRFFSTQPSLWSNSHIHTWLLEKHSFDLMDLCQQIMSLLFSMLSRLVIAFLPRSKCLLISWLLSPSAEIGFLYSSTLKSTLDYWKNHSFD